MTTYTVPNAEPYLFLPAGTQVGCLLLHGFTAMPEEMHSLGEYLAGRGIAELEDIEARLNHKGDEGLKGKPKGFQ